MNLQVGDVLAGKPEADAPYARIFMNGRYIPISFAADGMFLPLGWKTVKDWEEDELELELVALSTGERLTVITTVESLSSNVVIHRGKSMVVPESCGTVSQ